MSKISSKYTTEKKQFLYLLLIMFVVAIVIAMTSILALHQHQKQEHIEKLTQIAKGRARIIESVAKFDQKYYQNYPNGAREATLDQFIEAHKNFSGFGKTGEFLLAEKQDEKIVFILQHRKHKAPAPTPVPLTSTLAEPMRLALKGKSGVIVDYDYKGNEVLAAYEPVAIVNLGLVAKIDMEEVQEPIFNAIKLVVWVGLFIIIIGSVVFSRVSEPLIRALREREERFKTLFENSVDSYFVNDGEGEIIDANNSACRSLGYTREELLRMNLGDFEKGFEPEALKKIYKEILNGKDFNEEGVQLRKDGTQFPVEISAGKILILGKSYILATVRDISQRKESEERIKSAQKQIVASQKLAGVGQLAAGISHEVLNPVNIISVHTQMLQKKTKDDSKIQNFCEKIKHEINRIQKIMGSLLSFSRRGDSEFIKGAIKDEIEKTLLIIEGEYKLDNIKIIRNWCGSNVKMLIDPDKIRQVFLNLFQNSKSAMPQGGSITLSCKPVKGEEENYHQFFISDTGLGMSEEIRLKIFDPFFTTKPEGEGTGLGLSVVHGIIGEHGGKISVDSEEGKGTTFIINFPVTD